MAHICSFRMGYVGVERVRCRVSLRRFRCQSELIVHRSAAPYTRPSPLTYRPNPSRPDPQHHRSTRAPAPMSEQFRYYRVFYCSSRCAFHICSTASLCENELNMRSFLKANSLKLLGLLDPIHEPNPRTQPIMDNRTFKKKTTAY